VRFQILTAASMKFRVFWAVSPCSHVEVIALMMEAVSTSETSNNYNVTTRRYIPEDSKLQYQRRFKMTLHKWANYPWICNIIWGLGWLSQYSVLTTDWTTGVRSPTEAKDFSSTLCVQTSSEIHPASYRMGNRSPFPEVKRGRGVTLTTHPNWCQGKE
jgi:hypothetical protein